MPDWPIPMAFFVLVMGAVFFAAWRNTRRMIDATLARRANPARHEFVAMLSEDVCPETAEFLWDSMIDLVAPRLTPHPDDHLVDDLPIDPDEPAMNWMPEFAERHGVKAESWPRWPEAREATVRNFARWLEAGLPPRQRSAA